MFTFVACGYNAARPSRHHAAGRGSNFLALVEYFKAWRSNLLSHDALVSTYKEIKCSSESICCYKSIDNAD